MQVSNQDYQPYMATNGQGSINNISPHFQNNFGQGVPNYPPSYPAYNVGNNGVPNYGAPNYGVPNQNVPQYVAPIYQEGPIVK